MGLYFLLGVGCLLLQIAVSGGQTTISQVEMLQESQNSDIIDEEFPALEVFYHSLASLFVIFRDCGVGHMSLIFAADEITYKSLANCLKWNSISFKNIIKGLTSSIPPLMTEYQPLVEGIVDYIEPYLDTFIQFVGRILKPLNKLVPNLIQVIADNLSRFDQEHFMRDVIKLIEDFVGDVEDVPPLKLHEVPDYS